MMFGGYRAFFWFTEYRIVLEAFLTWNSVILSFQCKKWGYRNSPEYRGYSDTGKNDVKIDDFWGRV